MGRTIKGKPISKVLEELAIKKEPDKLLCGKYPYYEIDTYIQRITDVVGLDHFNEEVIKTSFSSVSSGQEMFSAVCRITLLDDDYIPIFHKDGIGGREVEYSEKTGQYGGLKNIENNANINAFKAAWQQLNIFGVRDISVSDESPDTVQGSNKKPQVENQKVSLKTADRFSITDERNGRPVYKVKAYRDKDLVEVIFYPNQYRKALDIFEQVLDKQDAPQRLEILVSSSGVREGIPQLIFKGFAA